MSETGINLSYTHDKLEIFDGAKPSDDNKSYVMISHYKHSLIPLIFRLSVELS